MSDQCKEKNVSSIGGFGFHQCTRKAKRDGYCTQHHPDSVAKRREESDRKWNEKQANSPYAKLKEAQATIATLQARIEELKNPWVSVDGVENAPEGDWLFLLEDGKQHTGTVHPNGCIIGGHFYFDMQKAVAYAPLPTPPEEPQ